MLGFRLFCVDVLPGLHISFFHSFAFSFADKIQGRKRMLANYSEMAFRVVEMFPENLLSSVIASIVKSQGNQLLYRFTHRNISLFAYRFFSNFSYAFHK